MKLLNVGLIQMNSVADKFDNLTKACELIRSGVSEGATFLLLPEVFNFRGHRDDMISESESIEGLTISTIRSLCLELSVWVLVSSFSEVSSVEDRIYNTSVLINDSGDIVSLYRKIHLF